jgi:hypothetical protein
MALKPAKVGGAGIAHEARGRYRRTVGPLWSLRERGRSGEIRSDEGSKMPLEVEPGSARARHRPGGAGIENMHLTQISSGPRSHRVGLAADRDCQSATQGAPDWRAIATL